MHWFKIYGIWPQACKSKQASKHTHTLLQCSHASVGLAQVHPNYTLSVILASFPDSHTANFHHSQWESENETTVCLSANLVALWITPLCSMSTLSQATMIRLMTLTTPPLIKWAYNSQHSQLASTSSDPKDPSLLEMYSAGPITVQHSERGVAMRD